MEHYEFNFEFLLVLDHGDVTCDCLKGRVIGRRRMILKHNVFWEE